MGDGIMNGPAKARRSWARLLVEPEIPVGIGPVVFSRLGPWVTPQP
jgi:hypothetical protein